MTVVTTAVYGGYDTLHPQAAQDIDVDWICFTDDPGLQAPAPWQVIYAPALRGHPCMAAKVHKCVAGERIWVDANIEVTASSFARVALASRRDGVAVSTHPRRDCVYTEADASLGAEGQDGKYATEPIPEQVAAYRAEGHPAHAGLYALGVVAWSPSATALAAAWLAECDRWSFQDQIAFPVVCRRAGVTPGVLPYPQIERARTGWLENEAYRIHRHRATV